MSKLRVLTLTGYVYPGGTANRIFGIAKGLDKTRFEHTVAMLQERNPEIESRYGTLLPQYEEAGIPVISLGGQSASSARFPLRLMRSVSTLRTCVEAIERVVAERAIDIIDAQSPAAAVAASIAGRRAKKPVVFTLYWVGKPAPVVMWPVVGRLSLDMATAVVTDSHARARDIKTWMFRGHDKVAVIPNGVPLQRSSLSREEARARLGVPPDAVVVAQVGALVPHKGQTVLLDAARELLRSHPSLFVLLVGHARGETGFDERLRAQARDAGISDRVRIGGYDGPIADVWQAADIQAHPSLFDSLPAAIIEGMSAGKPCVASTTGGIPEMVEHGETGLLVAPNDARALAAALKTILDDRELVERYGDAAFRRYQERYTPQATARDMEALFYRCVGWA